jgi:hypothetical protein
LMKHPYNLPGGTASKLGSAAANLRRLVPLGLSTEEALKVNDVEGAEKKLKVLVPLGLSTEEALKVTDVEGAEKKLKVLVPLGLSNEEALKVTDFEGAEKKLKVLVPLGLSNEEALKVTDVEGTEKNLRAFVHLGIPPAEAARISSIDVLKTALKVAESKIPSLSRNSSAKDVVVLLLTSVSDPKIEDILRLSAAGLNGDNLLNLTEEQLKQAPYSILDPSLMNAIQSFRNGTDYHDICIFYIHVLERI